MNFLKILTKKRGEFYAYPFIKSTIGILYRFLPHTETLMVWFVEIPILKLNVLKSSKKHIEMLFIKNPPCTVPYKTDF